MLLFGEAMPKSNDWNTPASQGSAHGTAGARHRWHGTAGTVRLPEERTALLQCRQRRRFSGAGRMPVEETRC